MSNYIFRRATCEEMPRILAMQSDVFSGEQGIPADDIDTFMAKNPLCWCAESPEDGKIYAAVAAWNENGETHWGRFVVFPAARGHHLGTALARAFYNSAEDGVFKALGINSGRVLSNICATAVPMVAYAHNFSAKSCPHGCPLSCPIWVPKGAVVPGLSPIKRFHKRKPTTNQDKRKSPETQCFRDFGALRKRNQRLLNWGARRAALRPYFLRSFIRGSRVRKPAFLRVPRSSGSALHRAREMP